MKMKGQSMLMFVSNWFWILLIALVVLGVLAAVFGFNLIPNAREWLLRIMGVG